jgi:hypothetical protein
MTILFQDDFQTPAVGQINTSLWENATNAFGGDNTWFSQNGGVMRVSNDPFNFNKIGTGAAQSITTFSTPNYLANWTCGIPNIVADAMRLGIRWRDNDPPGSATGYYAEIFRINSTTVSTRIIVMPSGAVISPLTSRTKWTSSWFLSAEGNRIRLGFDGVQLALVQDDTILDPGKVFMYINNTTTAFSASSILLNVGDIIIPPDNLFYRTMQP